mgnify:FL=1
MVNVILATSTLLILLMSESHRHVAWDRLSLCVLGESQANCHGRMVIVVVLVDLTDYTQSLLH